MCYFGPISLGNNICRKILVEEFIIVPYAIINFFKEILVYWSLNCLFYDRVRSVSSKSLSANSKFYTQNCLTIVQISRVLAIRTV